MRRNAQQPHQLGLAIPLRSIASRLCGALGIGWEELTLSIQTILATVQYLASFLLLPII
jgi:hypothetical protein